MELIRKISIMLYPIIPESIEKSLKIFNIDIKDLKFESITNHNFLKEGSVIKKIPILFKKIDRKNND